VLRRLRHAWLDPDQQAQIVKDTGGAIGAISSGCFTAIVAADGTCCAEPILSGESIVIDSMASLLSRCGIEAALVVARDLDAKVGACSERPRGDRPPRVRARGCSTCHSEWGRVLGDISTTDREARADGARFSLWS
jgi:hypothetical protein